MAKKGQFVQLQTEITNEWDWKKLLDKTGLIVIDVYSEWCGPCSAMCSYLKKIKLELGGDNLHLAIAKSDNIEALKRFRDRSEPIWLLVYKKKMINLMFGSDAPKLTRLIAEELERNVAVEEGKLERPEYEITDISEAEKERVNKEIQQQEEAERIETETKTRIHREQMEAACKEIYSAFPNSTIILSMPVCKDKILNYLSDKWEPIRVSVYKHEKIIPKIEQFKDLTYFSDWKFSENNLKDLVGKQTLVILLNALEDFVGEITEVVSTLLYGENKSPPGDIESVAQKIIERSPEEVPEELPLLMWTPENAFTKALAIKMFFPKLTEQYTIPDEESVIQHVIIAYDAFKHRDLQDLIKQYPDCIVRLGFFSNEEPGKGTLIAKTLEAFEARTCEITYEEKLVLQVATKNKDLLKMLKDHRPVYLSANTLIGAEDSKWFFPSNYDVDEEEIVEVKKKTVKKKSKKGGVTHNPPSDTATDEVALETGTAETGDHLESALVEEAGSIVGVDEISFHEKEDDFDVSPSEMHKATSPLFDANDCPVDGLELITNPETPN